MKMWTNEKANILERTRTGLTAGGPDWLGPNVHLKAILKMSILTDTTYQTH